MDPYTPRPILIDSTTMTDCHFLSGFVNFPQDNPGNISVAKLIPAKGSDLPCLFYNGTKADKWLPARMLPPFTFSNQNPIPKDFDVEFQYGDKKSPKIKVSATMGHPDNDQPDLYKPRVFILGDTFTNNTEVEGSRAYAFLVDICEGDIITYMVSPGETFIVTIDTSNNNGNEISTAIFMFPIDIIVPAFTLDLVGKNKGTEEIPFSGAPVFQPGNDPVGHWL